MIKIDNKVDCCGCNACGDICPHDAISFKTDNEGFWYPKVDMVKCIDCHLCEKVCPIIHAEELKKNDYKEPICYAVQHKNLESLFNSTSGSAFAGLAEQMYKQDGYVGGAIFNDDFSVRQFISSEKKDLDILRNSKYVQSESQGFYKQVKELLDKDEKVLVCSLPCQIAAIKSYLKKEYENLITVDLICRNINSPKILKKYIEYLEEQFGSKVVYLKHKNKELGWRQLTLKVVFENGKVLYDTKDTSYFTVGFISTSVFGRPSCYDCKFKGFPRISDITIGDFWGAQKAIGEEFDHDLGTSVVLINSEKGKKYFETVKNLRSIAIPLESIPR
jgi:coenzyme F420-reducing hydrogenase beta subunit